MLDMPIPGSFRNKDHFEKIIFACGKSYITFAMRKTIADGETRTRNPWITNPVL